MFKLSALSQIWKKYIQKLNDWDLPLITFHSILEEMIGDISFWCILLSSLLQMAITFELWQTLTHVQY